MTTSATTVATLPVALHAITGHVLAHRLGAPHDIDSRGSLDGGPRIQLWVHAHDVPAWLVSGFHETTRTNSPLSHDSSWERVDLDGSIPTPVGDVEIRLTFTQPAARRLVAVTGASA